MYLFVCAFLEVEEKFMREKKYIYNIYILNKFGGVREENVIFFIEFVD